VVELVGSLTDSSLGCGTCLQVVNGATATTGAVAAGVAAMGVAARSRVELWRRGSSSNDDTESECGDDMEGSASQHL
jgi:hypothetical protein